nr:uncharacterized protein LOC128706054 [Cherax quadricarinatus]
MMRSYCLQYSKDWDEGIPLLLFALRESEQDNLKFSPFELIYGHQIRGPVQVLKEAWTGEETPTFRSSPTLMKERLSLARELAAENLRQAQNKMKEEYDRRTKLRSFEPKDQVLVQRFHQGHALQPKFEGPLEIVKCLSDVNYLVRTPKRRNSQRTYHVNQLKPYSGIVSPISTITPLNQERVQASSDEMIGVPVLLNNSTALKNLNSLLINLEVDKGHEIKSLIKANLHLFNDVPKPCTLGVHDVTLREPTPIKQSPYRVSPKKQGEVAPLNAKVKALLEFPTPKDRKSVSRFLGVAGYYRRFCPNFAQVAFPLTELTSPSFHGPRTVKLLLIV